MTTKSIIRVFPRRTSMTPADDLVFFDEPPLFDLPDLPVYVSVTFTWDLPRAWQLYEAWRRRMNKVALGGPAMNTPSGGFAPGLFLKEGVTITSRGCCRRCRLCLVPDREGDIRECERFAAGSIVQDNNLLACTRRHVERVFDMLMRQRRGATFAGGLDARLLARRHIDWFKHKAFRLKEAWFACDSPAALVELDRVADLMADFPLRKKRCYVLAGYESDDTPAAAERRCAAILTKGFCPFLMLYQPAQGRQYDPTWKAVQRKWTRPAAYLKKAPVAPERDNR